MGIESRGVAVGTGRRALAVLAAAALAVAAGCGEEDGGPVAATGPSASSPAPQRPAAPCAKGAPAAPVTLVYATAPTTTAPRIAPAAVEETVAVLCARLDALGHDAYRVRATGGGRIRVDLGDAPETDRALREVDASNRLAVYDWEPNVLGDQGPDAPYAGVTALHDAVAAASTSVARAEATDVPPEGPSPAVQRRYGGDEDGIRRFYDRRNDTHLGRCYLFDADDQLVAGPEPDCGDLHGAAADSPDGALLLAVPRGVVVVEAMRSPDQPEDVHGYFVLEDDAELSNAAIDRPALNTDARTNEPIVTIDFTDPGREAFAALTERVARRGAEAILPPGTDPELALQRFAIVLDDEVASLAAIDHREHPEGIDGRGGAQIDAIGDLQTMQDLAESLRIGPPPLDLKLVEQR